MNWKKKLIPTTLAIGLLAPTSGMATESEVEPVQQPLVQQDGAEHDPVNTMRFQHALIPHGIHSQTYLTLLADQYAPELTDAYDQAFTEREDLLEPFKDARGESMNEVKKDPNNVTKTKKETFQARHKDNARHQLFQDLGEALEEKDSQKIQSVLKQILEELQKENEHLAQLETELQQTE